jgi:serpin B
MTNLESKNEADYHNPLQITNAIFVGKNVTLRRDFAQTFMDYYRGSSINVDFSSRDAVDAVNRWASQSTNGLIKNVI